MSLVKVNKRFPAPKRRIERVRSRVNQQVMDGTPTDLVLHVAEDAKTLVRILIDGNFFPGATQTTPQDQTVEIMLRVNPQGVVVITPSGATGLDQSVGINEISSSMFTVGQLSIEAWWMHPYRRDIKAQRKLRENDEIALSLVCDLSNRVLFTGLIYMWFKE